MHLLGNVRFGSKADIGADPRDVCFTPQKRTLVEDQDGHDVWFVPELDLSNFSKFEHRDATLLLVAAPTALRL